MEAKPTQKFKSEIFDFSFEICIKTAMKSGEIHWPEFGDQKKFKRKILFF